MDIERHARLTDLFEELSALAPGPAREARLIELCGDDAGLRADLEELLRFDAEEDELSPGAVLRSDLEGAWARESVTLEDRDAETPARYEILRLLGEGGFGSVYLAREEEPIPRLVAIKVIKPGMDTREVLLRFDSERRALATMDHPGIARAFTAGRDQRGRPYFVMEYVEGQAITAFCDAEQLDVRRRLELFVEVCEAIQHAHFKGIVHRDIKPANVLVTTTDGRPTPKTIDFGIAKALEQPDGASVLTRAGQLVGTLATMSPEQARGAEVDTRADVYALGGLVYELLCGRPPFSFEGDTADLADLRRRVLEEDPPRPSARVRGDSAELLALANRRKLSPRALERVLADDLDWIVMKALEKDSARRYSSPSELAADVQRYLANEPIRARPPSRSYQAAKFARRHVAGLVAASIMLALLIAGSIGTAVGWRRAVAALKVARDQETYARDQETIARDQEALAREQEALALHNLERARSAEADALSINAFLNDDLLSAVSPESMGYDVPMRQVLDAAARRVDGRFEQSPRVEREIRTTLGRTYRALGLTERAMEQLVAGLAIEANGADGESGSGDSRTAEVRERGRLKYELGRVHLQKNRNVEAEQVLRDLWKECSATLGVGDPLTIDALHFLGVSLAEQERFEEARGVFDESLARALETVGEEHELAIQALHSQGLLYLSWEMMEDTQFLDVPDLLDRALRASLALHGSDDPRTIRRMLDLASAVSRRGELEEAVSLYEEAHELSVRVQGPMHPTTASAALSLGVCQYRSGSVERAEAAIEEALAIALPLGKAHPILSNAQNILATLRLKQGRFGEAEELALGALESFELQGTSAPFVLDLLARICESDGRPDEADEWRRMLEQNSGAH